MAYFDIVRPKMTLFKITPDKGVTNNTNKKFWRMMHELLALDYSIKERIERSGLKIRYRLRDNIWFDVVARAYHSEDHHDMVEGEKETKHKVEFFMACPAKFAPTIKSKMIDRYPQATIEEVDFSAVEVPADADVIEYRYKRHDVFSLNCNDTEQTTPISSLLNAAYELQAGDFMRFSVCVERIDRKKWKGMAEYGWGLLDQKRVPQRVRFEPSKLLESAADVVKFLAFEVKGLLDDVLHTVQNSFFKDDGKRQERPKITFHSKEYDALMANGKLSDNTIKKQFEPVFAANIRLSVHSQDKARKHMIANSVTGALNELKGDNYLEPRKVRVNIRAKHIEEMNTFQRLTGHDPDRNIMSCKELGKLNQYPGRELQAKYADLLDVKPHLEVDIPAEFRDERGLYIADAVVKGTKIPIHLPATKSHWDELCLPKVVIGGQGQGKTAGFGGNLVVEAVKKGFGGIAIDAAKGQIGDEVVAALPADKVRRFNLANTVFGLDWCEVKHAPRGRGMLADAVLAFFDDNTDTAGAQTQRFLMAAVYGMQTGKLKEIVKIFRDEKYRAEVITKMPDTIHRETLAEYHEYKPDRQRQIAAPIFNRLNVVLGDEWLMQCFDSDLSIDMVELMSTPQAVIFDLPKRDGLTEKQIDILANLLTTKINLAMQLRPEEKQFPFFVVYDEPHRFLRSANLWESLAVESRKWRVSFVWMFHEWLMIPRELRQIIKSALPHYFLYPSDYQTFADLAHYIQPFEPDDAIKLQRFHAINCIRLNSVIQPFIAKMAAPPSQRSVQAV